MTRRNVAAGLALALAAPALLAAQLPVPPGPPVDPDLQFEAASIKPYDATSGGAMMRMMPGQLDAVGIPVRLLLRQALRVQDYQLIGLPSWADTERYAIVAKAPAGAQQNAMPVMLVNLLKDRLKLATHAETREMPILNLVLARADGKLGAGLKPSSPECQAMISARAAGPGPGGPGRPGGPGAGPGGPGGPGGPAGPAAGPGRGAPPGPGGPGGPPSFDEKNPPCGGMRMGGGVAAGGGIGMAQIVQLLSQFTGRPVNDKTGLTGVYDFSLKFTPDPGLGGGSNPFGPPPPGTPQLAPDADPNAPNIFTAVQEQLGLKLDSTRGPVPVTVIDRIEKPTLD
ncbi:MAG TPA: TIGR03435 family protein [Vicinamibacterales bacterium]|nr:TIGR03435 family protein [Vicinamibacterales bacterium]